MTHPALQHIDNYAPEHGELTRVAEELVRIATFHRDPRALVKLVRGLLDEQGFENFAETYREKGFAQLNERICDIVQGADEGTYKFAEDALEGLIITVERLRKRIGEVEGLLADVQGLTADEAVDLEGDIRRICEENEDLRRELDKKVDALAEAARMREESEAQLERVAANLYESRDLDTKLFAALKELEEERSKHEDTKYRLGKTTSLRNMHLRRIAELEARIELLEGAQR